MKDHIFMGKGSGTGGTLAVTEQNMHLTAAYIKMNEEGREVLDRVIQKLVKTKRVPRKMACMGSF